jgi:hypothetical protein
MRYDAVAFLESLFQPTAGGGQADAALSSATPPAVTPADLPAAWHVVWDERAAIMEYDGGLPREQAEHFALIEVLEQLRGES